MKKLQLEKEDSVTTFKPYKSKSAKVLMLDKSQLMLGMELETNDNPADRDNDRVLHIFTMRKGQMQSVDILHYNTKNSDRPFFWEYSFYCNLQTGRDVKRRLQALGFDPKVIDMIVDKQTSNQ
jgi:hypothetical protein